VNLREQLRLQCHEKIAFELNSDSEMTHQVSVGIQGLLIVLDALDQKDRQLVIARDALHLCGAQAGSPDPSDACRLILATAHEALAALPKEKS